MTNKQIDRGIEKVNECFNKRDIGLNIFYVLEKMLKAMKEPEEEKIQVSIDLSPCCKAGITVYIDREGEYCTACGKRIDKPDPIKEGYDAYKKCMVSKCDYKT